jgi:thiamine transport system permease protein
LRFSISKRPIAWHGIAGIAVTMLLLLPPLLALFVAGVMNFHPRAALLQASLVSLLIALLSAMLVLVMSWPVARLAIRSPRWRGRLLAVSLLGLIVPPAVMATGWFILLRGSGAGVASTILLIALLNTLMALPFSVTLLTSGMAGDLPHYDRLCAQLGLGGWRRLLRIDLPGFARPLAQAGLMALVMSFGDLTAVTLLGSHGLITLPSLIASEMGNYRSSSAQATALLLTGICLAGAALANRLGRAT